MNWFKNKKTPGKSKPEAAQKVLNEVSVVHVNFDHGDKTAFSEAVAELS